ncbi:MAG: hypothetical protein H6972_00455 [Gammaproteobacteria bacterium]|nr:hypothetical protein [Gammaproteobacteria bacterium]
MPCSSTGYIVQNGTSWKQQSSADVKSQSKSAESHAEREAYNGFKNKPGPYLIVQDAFPCFDKCHQYFLKCKNSVIIKVTADNTFDGNSYVQGNLITGLTFPCYIYYHAATATFSVGTPGAPAAFPVHPSPASV